VLFWTLDQLVSRYGEAGTFYINDLYEEYAEWAVDKLTQYAQAKGYCSVEIKAFPGDYRLIDSGRYTTIHLKNPEISFFYDQMDGDFLYTSDGSRHETREMLSRLASRSESGLHLFILYHEDFIPPQEIEEFISKGLFYHETAEWEALPYIYPEGNLIDKELGKVYRIDSLSALDRMRELYVQPCQL
jgi:hypothetical protein